MWRMLARIALWVGELIYVTSFRRSAAGIVRGPDQDRALLCPGIVDTLISDRWSRTTAYVSCCFRQILVDENLWRRSLSKTSSRKYSVTLLAVYEFNNYQSWSRWWVRFLEPVCNSNIRGRDKNVKFVPTQLDGSLLSGNAWLGCWRRVGGASRSSIGNVDRRQPTDDKVVSSGVCLHQVNFLVGSVTSRLKLTHLRRQCSIRWI